MSEVFFTSDTHFGSLRTLELSQRPFKSVQEMDECLIENWNSIVTQKDTVYHIGDFGNYETLKLLNGKVNLIIGNHEIQDFRKKAKEELEKYPFNSVRYRLLLHINKNTFFLAHKPNDAQKKNPNIFNLFGHIHGLQKAKKYGMDVGVDAHHFYPINLDTVLFYRTGIRGYYDSNVFN